MEVYILYHCDPVTQCIRRHPCLDVCPKNILLRKRLIAHNYYYGRDLTVFLMNYSIGGKKINVRLEHSLNGSYSNDWSISVKLNFTMQ